MAEMLDALEPHSYQLQHDGYLQFGIVTERDEALNEVFVSETKHLKVWFSDVVAFRSVMAQHGLAEAERLEFIDEYPRVTTRLPPEKVVQDVEALASHLAAALAGKPAN